MSNHLRIIFKKIAWFLLLTFLLIGIALVYFLKFFDPNHFRSYIVKQIEYSTKGQVKILGDLNLKMKPYPHVELRDSVVSVKLGENEVIIDSKELDLEIALRPLLKKNFYLTTISAKDANITIKQELGNTELDIESFLGKVEITPCCYQIKDFVVTTLDNTFQGNILILQKDNKVHISGELFAKVWQISESNAASKNTLSEILKFFDPFIISLKVKIGELRYQKKHFRDLAFHLTSENHHFKLNPSAKLIKGKLFSNIDVALKGEEINISLDLKSKDTETKEVLSFFDVEPLPISGKAALNFKGRTKGNTVSQWKANLTGDLSVDYQEVNVLDSKAVSPLSGTIKMPLSQGKIQNISGSLFTQSWQIGKDGKSLNTLTDFLLDLSRFNLSLAVKILNFQYEMLKFNNVVFQLKLQKGLVIFNPIADFARGKIVSSFKVNPKKEKSRIDFTLAIKNALASDFISQFGENKHFMSGVLNLDFKGTTMGNSLAQWKSELTGNLLVHLVEARLHPNVKHIANELGDVFHCIAVKSPVYKGVLQQKQNIGFDSSRVKGLGSGQYNLNTNQLDYYFEIVTNRKLDLNLGGTIHFVRVTGTLQNPRATLSSTEMLNQAGRITLGILTGGYSLLVEKLRDVLIQKKSACSTILNTP